MKVTDLLNAAQYVIISRARADKIVELLRTFGDVVDPLGDEDYQEKIIDAAYYLELNSLQYTDELKALKASILPVSEDEPAEQPTDAQDNVGCKCDKKYGFINETTDNKVICVECRKIIESNFSFIDNWTDWDNQGRHFISPDLPSDTRVDVLDAHKGHVTYNRKVSELYFGKHPSFASHRDIIAYRIIEGHYCLHPDEPFVNPGYIAYCPACRKSF